MSINPPPVSVRLVVLVVVLVVVLINSVRKEMIEWLGPNGSRKSSGPDSTHFNSGFNGGGAVVVDFGR